MKLHNLIEAKETSKELEFYANKDNWPKDLEAAKEFAKKAVLKWQWHQKKPEFMGEIDRAPSVDRVQGLLLYPLLKGEGLGVIK